jgi:hypothetical protein
VHESECGTLETYRRSLRTPVVRAALLATQFGRRPDPRPPSGGGMRRCEFITSIVQSGSRLVARRVCATEGDITSEAISLVLSGEDGRGGTFLAMWH